MSPNTTPSAPTETARRPVCLPLRARAGVVDSGVVGIVWSPIGGSGFSFDLIVGREASRAESRRLFLNRAARTFHRHCECRQCWPVLAEGREENDDDDRSPRRSN